MRKQEFCEIKFNLISKSLFISTNSFVQFREREHKISIILWAGHFCAPLVLVFIAEAGIAVTHPLLAGSADEAGCVREQPD